MRTPPPLGARCPVASINVDTSCPHAGCKQHFEDIEARSEPLPTGVEALVRQAEHQLTALADEAA